MRVRPAPLAAVLALIVLAPAGHASAATVPLVGAWTWSDRDESLDNGRNPSAVSIRRRGSRLVARFGRQRPRSVAWNPRRRSFHVVTPRRVGTDGEQVALVDYRGQLRRVAGRWRIEGTLRIRSRRFRGTSPFVATRLSNAA